MAEVLLDRLPDSLTSRGLRSSDERLITHIGHPPADPLIHHPHRDETERGLASARVTSHNSRPERILNSTAELAARAIWFVWILVLALITIGVPLAVVGAFDPWLVIPSTIILGIWFQHLLESRIELVSLPDRSAAVLFLVALGIVSLATIGNLAKTSQHHATNRDPGVYLETGLWLADNGSVIIDGRQGPFLGLDELNGGGLGFTEIDDGTGRLNPQFGHATAVVIAAGSWLGGTAGAIRVPALLMAMALILWWFAIRSVSNPTWATIGVTALSLDLVIVHVSRDTFSEPLAFALVAGSVVILSNSPSSGRWLLAGWAIGISVSARIDMMVVVFGAMLLAATVLRRRTRDTVVFIAATGATVGISFVDLALRSPAYLDDRWPSLVPVVWASVMVAILTLASLNRSWFRLSSRAAGALASIRPAAMWSGVVAIIGAFVYALYLRPHLSEQHSGFSAHIAGLQTRDGLDVDGTRTYGESAMSWLTWYMGLPAVVLAVVGAAIAWALTLNQRRPKLMPALALVGPLTLLYLQRPRITGDQVWALRRFVPTAIPLMILLASLAGFELVKWLRPRVPSGGTAAALVAVAALMVVPPAVVTWPLRSEHTLLWPTHTISDLCGALGPDSAVLISGNQLLGDQLIRTVARTCDVPTARADMSEVDVAKLADDWLREGRTLLVVAYSGEQIADATIVTDFDMPQQMLEQAVERIPSVIESGTRRITIWRAATLDG